MEREILNLINNSSDILIITHVNPDGDTLGSACALKLFIEKDLNKKADILIQIKDDSQFPKTYKFLPCINEAKTLSNLKEDYDLVIAVDTASLDRIIENASNVFKKAKNTVVIDHHKTNTGFGKINYIKGGISSTAEVLYDLFINLDRKISKEIAMCLYVGILTDTGCFKYESTTSNTFNIASKLTETGIDISNIADLCYTNKPKNMILFQNYLVSNAKFCFNDRVAYTLITKEIIEKYKAHDEYTEGIAETLRSIERIEASFVLKETDSGVKVSIRTKNIDATKITEKFKGGGHKRAAGCTIKENIGHAVEILLKEISELLI